jgi:Family of unknown function (DUF5360)
MGYLMSRPLIFAICITDILFILYWALTALAALHVINIPPEWLFSGYDQPRIVAWNWSFFPLDIAFSLTGLAAVRAARRGNRVWRPLAIISLTLTITAGGMAISYWVILREFDPAWFLPNLALFVWPFFFMPQLVKAH